MCGWNVKNYNFPMGDKTRYINKQNTMKSHLGQRRLELNKYNFSSFVKMFCRITSFFYLMLVLWFNTVSEEFGAAVFWPLENYFPNQREI